MPDVVVEVTVKLLGIDVAVRTRVEERASVEDDQVVGHGRDLSQAGGGETDGGGRGGERNGNARHLARAARLRRGRRVRLGRARRRPARALLAREPEQLGEMERLASRVGLLDLTAAREAV